MAFKLVRSDAEANDCEEWPITSLTLTAGDLLEVNEGTSMAVVADSSSQGWQRLGVCNKSATSSDGYVEVTVVNPSQIWEVATTNNSNTAHNGDRQALTNRYTVNNAGTVAGNTGVVIQLAPSGAAADKKILCRFVDASGGTTYS